MIIKMSLITALYVTITAALWIWVYGKNKKMTNGKKLFIGVLYGMCAIMSTHFGVLYETMILNVRDIAPLAAGLFFHPVSGIIAGLVGGIERYIAGEYFGVGSYTRIACSVSTCLAGFLAAWLNLRLFKGKKPSPFYAFFLGGVMEVFHMYVVFITHRADMKQAFNVVRTCSIPMIIFTAIGMACSAVVIYILSGKMKNGLHKPKEDELSISVKFQVGLFVYIVIMLVFTFGFSFSIQTRTAIQNAQNTMNINYHDTKSTYMYASGNYRNIKELIKEQSLITANAVALSVDKAGGVNKVKWEELEELKDIYDLYEIDVISSDGIVVNSSNPLSINYDMNSAEQSKPFLDILSGKKREFVQEYMPTGRDKKLSLMYVGVKASDGLVQVALDDDMIKKYLNLVDIENTIGNRHIGESGAIYIIDDKEKILMGDDKGKTLAEIGMSNIPEEREKYFEAYIAGEKTYCCIGQLDDGNSMLITLPMSEVYASRDASAYETALADILLFAVIFVLMYILVQKIVINNLYRINGSLAKITRGNLNEIVNVRSSSEFASLSDDINLTVSALKGYIEQAEKRIEEELEFARQIQSAALPKVFNLPRSEFEIFAFMEPAKEIGGDFYDFFFVDKNKIALVIADVSGKGIPAALFMMRSKTAIKGFAESGRSPSEIFEKANNVLCEGNDADMFVTAWIGIVDLETGKVQCANAGHEYPIIKRADGKWELFKDKHALALAAMEDMIFKEYELQLNEGDKIFVYTDGVPEAINEKEEQFGTERTVEYLNNLNDSSMRLLLPDVRLKIKNFVGEAEQFDDITMLGFAFVKKTAE